VTECASESPLRRCANFGSTKTSRVVCGASLYECEAPV
jgi:hypothetical protein